MSKKIFALTVLIFLILGPISLFSLDYTDFYGDWSDSFYPLLDKNGGLTVFRSLLIPSGGRSESMGTAFTALANDIGFFEYNPAASSVLEKTEFAFFHNAWIADSAVETIAYTMRLKNLGLGAAVKCFYVPFTEYNIFGERASSGYYNETTATLNLSYNFLSGYNFKGIALGANLKASYRGMPDFADDSTMEIIDGSGLAQSAIGIMADVGMQMRFNLWKFYSSREPNFHFGLVLSNLGAAFTGLGENITWDDQLPSRVAVGVSYKPIRPLLFSLEFRQPFNLSNFSISEKWSVAFGTSIQCTDFFSFQAGFLLSGANPRISFGTEFNVRDFLININYTFDMTSSVNPINRISLCAKMDLGDRGRKSLQNSVDALYSEGLGLYNEEKLEEAIIVWEEALKLDNTFDPARECIEKAKIMLDLLESIREYQRLE